MAVMVRAKRCHDLCGLFMLGSLLACILMTGCALTPTVANIEIPEVANPKSGPAVRIVSVEDRREFVYPFKDCDTPSVPNAEALKNQELKARSFARQGRCSGGETTMHELKLLPKDEAVANKIQLVVEGGLKDAGYQIETSQNANKDALPVKIQIDQSWATSPILDGVGVRVDTTQMLKIKVGEDEILAKSPYSEYHTLYINSTDIYQKSLLALQTNISLQLKRLNAGRMMN